MKIELTVDEFRQLVGVDRARGGGQRLNSESRPTNLRIISRPESDEVRDVKIRQKDKTLVTLEQYILNVVAGHSSDSVATPSSPD